MPETVIVALLSLVGTAIGVFGGMRLVTYRIEQLEKKVEKHNTVIERTFKLETRADSIDRDMEELKSDISDMKKDLAEIKRLVLTPPPCTDRR